MFPPVLQFSTKIALSVNSFLKLNQTAKVEVQFQQRPAARVERQFFTIKSSTGWLKRQRGSF